MKKETLIYVYASGDEECDESSGGQERVIKMMMSKLRKTTAVTAKPIV